MIKPAENQFKIAFVENPTVATSKEIQWAFATGLENAIRMAEDGMKVHEAAGAKGYRITCGSTDCTVAIGPQSA